MAASRRLLVGLAAVLPLAAACQLVLGLDRYEKVDGGQDAGPDELLTSEAGGQDVTAPDVFSAPIQWAATRMPNPRFNVGASDANFNFLDAYVVLDGAVSDPIFNRIWSPGASAAGTFEAATAYCEAQTIAGKKGRLPTRIELVSLLDFTTSAGPSALPGVFDGGQIPRMWTSSPVRPYNGNSVQYWVVDFDGKQVVPSEFGKKYAALCTQGAQ